MEDSEKIIKKREEKIKIWLKDPYNLTFLLIILSIIVVRFYYFWITKSQPLWWDEAEYMSTAKAFTGINPFDFKWALNRFPGFSILVALCYMIGITNEPILRFLVAFLPSILAIILVYFVLISMYSDKKIALISIAIFSVLWEHLFYSNRFQTENVSLIFEFLAIIVLFKVYLKKEDWGFIKSKYALLWIVLFTLVCILFRSGNAFFIPILILFLIIVNFYKIPEKLRIASGVSLIILIIVGYIFMDFLSRRYAFISLFYQYAAPFDLKSFLIFYAFYQSYVPYLPSILLYAFLIGIITVIGGIIIFPEGLKKVGRNIKDNSYNADIFNLILISGFLFFFVFIIKAGGYNNCRWFFAFLPGMFAFTAKGLIKLGDFVQSFLNLKYLSLIIIILLLSLGVYTQYNHADQLIKIKIDSYSQVRDSGLWIKANSNPKDIVVSASLTQHRYYAERNIIDFYANGSNENETAFNAKVLEYKPKYVVLSGFEPGFTPKWAYDWPQRHNETVQPVKIYFSDPEKNTPILVIYEIKY